MSVVQSMNTFVKQVIVQENTIEAFDTGSMCYVKIISVNWLIIGKGILFTLV